MKRFILLPVLVTAAFVLSVRADVTPNPLFTDGAVLQQDASVPVWGTADPGERVTVEFAGQTVSATTAGDGRWMVRLKTPKATGPSAAVTMTISGKNKIALHNLLIGEVWLCSGQSNMERHLGLQPGQKPITDWEQEVRDANYPEIRQFYVEKKTAFVPEATVKGGWSVCSPETVKDFTAVGYFFGRDLHQARHLPIGLIHSSWGGTPAEAWTSEAALKTLPDFVQPLAELKRMRSDPEGVRRDYEAQLENWFRANDPGSAAAPWSATALDTASWKQMKLPTLWESAGEPDLDGVVWFRRTFDLPAGAANLEAELHLGQIDDIDTTWVNGVRVGAMDRYDLVRDYHVPAGVLKAGWNVVAVRVLDTGGGGGIWGNEKLQLFLKGAASAEPIDLSGAWQYRVGLNLKNAPWPPLSVAQNASAPTVLYNGMIAPLLPYAIRGVIWYQGESNVGRERQYRALFPAMIADWRRAWSEGNFPFLFVQIAPYNDMTPEIREAQLLAWQRTTNTAMAVTIDCGDAGDIHPAHKQPVGARLALAARAIAYGEAIEYSGPVFSSISIEGNEAILRFSHLGGGLLAENGALKGFTVAGADKIFHPAKAEIRGGTVAVSAEGVTQPAAVRYGWANVPEGNLFNRAGLPASPFRTDGD
jgi:sialate O-acetylesterase